MIYYTNPKLDLELKELSLQKQAFGRELKRLVSQKQNIEEIGAWAYSVYLEYCRYLKADLSQVMLDLNTMELGEQFAISYDMLNKIAEDLIADKNVDLNAKEYRESIWRS